MGSIGALAEDVTGLNLSGDSSTDQALRGQQAATQSSNALTKEMYEQNRADAQPWRDAGVKALEGLENPDFQKTFTFADFQADPGYQFRMAEGQKALERSAAAKGGLMSGAFAKAATRYGQDVASSEYDKAYTRFNNDASTRFNRLSSLAGIGQQAQSQMAQMGSDYANTVSGNNMGYANAEAAQAMGQQNQRNQMIGQGVSMATMALTKKPPGGGGGLAFCDERLKTDIIPLFRMELDDVRAVLKPYAYRYKNEGFGSGEWVGVMAQDLAKTKLGSTIVSEDEDGNLRVDMNKAISLCLAAIAEG